MSDQDDAIRACAREAAVQHGGFGNDGMVEVGVTAIRRWLSHRASRPPAPAPTGAALPEFPECAPGPWEPSNVFPSIILDRKRNTVFEVTPLFQDYGERMTVRDFILARVNARLLAPAAAPGVTLFCDENGRCLSRGPIFRREFAVGQDVIENGREYVVISDKPDGANRIVVLRASAPIAMSEADRARLAELDAQDSRGEETITVANHDFLRRLLTEAHARLESEKFMRGLDNVVMERLRAQADATGTVEPGELIAEVKCPCCGADLRVEHGDDEGEIGVVGQAPIESAKAEATGPGELTEEERERVQSTAWDFWRHNKDRIKAWNELMEATWRVYEDATLAIINRRTRPAASAVIPKVDPHEVSTCERCDVTFIVERTRSLIAAKIPGARLEES